MQPPTRPSHPRPTNTVQGRLLKSGEASHGQEISSSQLSHNARVSGVVPRRPSALHAAFGRTARLHAASLAAARSPLHVFDPRMVAAAAASGPPSASTCSRARPAGSTSRPSSRDPSARALSRPILPLALVCPATAGPALLGPPRATLAPRTLSRPDPSGCNPSRARPRQGQLFPISRYA
jgi:hypothetical protein